MIFLSLEIQLLNDIHIKSKYINAICLAHWNQLGFTKLTQMHRKVKNTMSVPDP